MVSRKAAGQPPLADAVHERLLAQFMDGTRAPGEALNIAILSRELEVSQTPIREALARLEHTGLVNREALKGYRVAPLLSEDELVALREARMVLEPALARAAAERVTPEFLSLLRETIEALDQASQSMDDARTFPAYLSADQQFHLEIAKQTGNQFLCAAYTALGGHVHRFRLFAALGASDAGSAVSEHRRIYDALSDQEGEVAAVRMLDHVRNAGTRALLDRRAVEPKYAMSDE